jgi:carboxyl-terminal processing protease
LAFALVVTVFAAGITVGRSRQAISRTPPDNSAATLEPFWETWNLAERHFVNGAQRQRLVQGAIRGLLDTLGDQGHTHYETKEEFERYVTVMNGEAHGIGVRLRLVHRLPRVLETAPGSPAREVGIQVGDVITAIDGSDTTGLPLNQVLALVRGGPAASPVRLSISRPGVEKVDVCLRRTKETMAPVVWQFVPDKSVMHLTIRQFDRRTHDLVRTALKDARRMNVHGVVVDLRNCPGGLVDQAIAVTSEFLPGGDIAIERTAEGKQIHHLVKAGGLATTVPVCVLINGETSSAGELMAAALKDHHRGPVIGSCSAGLGTMLHPYRMSDGSVVFLAIAEWLTPKGSRIWHQGVSPTIELQLPDEANALLPGAIAYLDPQTFEKLEDRQLDKALSLLCRKRELIAKVGGAILE